MTPIAPYDGGTMRWWARRFFQVGGATLSAPATAEYFARRNGVSTGPSTGRLPRGGASGTTWVEQTDHRDPGKPTVRLLTVHGGGHTVPGPRKAPSVLGRTDQSISAADVVSDFFGLAAAVPAPD